MSATPSNSERESTAEQSHGMDVNALIAQEEELRGRLQMYERQLDLLSNVREDKQRALATLRGLQGTEPGAEVLLPVGGTTYVRASLADNATVLKGIGAGYSMPRDIEKAMEELKAELEALDGDIQKTSRAAGEIEARHAQIMEILQGAGAEGPAMETGQ